jgi:hypothetical protein
MRYTTIKTFGHQHRHVSATIKTLGHQHPPVSATIKTLGLRHRPAHNLTHLHICTHVWSLLPRANACTQANSRTNAHSKMNAYSRTNAHSKMNACSRTNTHSKRNAQALHTKSSPECFFDTTNPNSKFVWCAHVQTPKAWVWKYTTWSTPACQFRNGYPINHKKLASLPLL